MSDEIKIDDGGPAFSTPVTKTCAEMGGFQYQSQHPGMSLRDWFAGQALVGLLATPGSPTREQCLHFGVDPDSKTAGADTYAATAYVFSDAMLRARGKKQ